MSTLYTINVTNNSPTNQDFYFFQKPAVYTGGTNVYSNSIYHQVLQPYATSGAVLTFQFMQQYYAGVQTQVPNLIVGQASGYTTASQAIDLTSASGSASNNSTNMSVSPSLGLTPPTFTAGVQPGAYRIVTPSFNPVTQKYNAGLAVKSTTTGAVVLSNFINAEPSKNIDCQPVLIFYVQTGGYQAGSVINFTTSSVGAALCDTTQGVTTFNVTYNADGSWTVGSVTQQPGLSQLIGQTNMINMAALAPAPNTVIMNEAGTGVVSTGNANNYDAPFTVSNLSNAGALAVHSEYQVGPSNGPLKGYMCTAIANGTATFA